MTVQEKRRYSLFPKSLSNSVEHVVKPVFKKHGFAESRILTQWRTIVGDELAACSMPQKLSFSSGKKEGGTLHLLVAGGRALELQHMQPIILDRINTYFGYGAVKKLVFTQTSGTLFRKETKAAEKKKLPPSSSINALVEQCEDPDLRAALLSLGSVLVADKN